MNDELDPDPTVVRSDATFDQIADDFLQRIRKNEFPTIQEYIERFPAWESDINELFPTLAELEKYDPFKRIKATNNRQFQSIPSLFGDYEIIGELGRGGMGIVYEAINRKLKRRVALKVLPVESANPELIARFEREARAAGQLHHTNIVPVFDVGEVDGMYFYSMQYIDGQSLDLILEEVKRLESAKTDSTKKLSDGGIQQSSASSPGRTAADTTVAQGARAPQIESHPDDSKPVLPEANVATEKLERESTRRFQSWSQVGKKGDGYFRRVAHVGIQVAKALDYAHQHGVLHRDIKPANLLLDTKGTVWITDFGLAKDGQRQLTHSGDIVGTLRYMAPERFNGESDPRSDLYSLGLTLYELCTLRYAFDQTDRAELVKRLTTQSPVPPRKIRPEIPLDLETIVAKSIAYDPKLRYQSASLMVADLSRFLSDRPVLARRVSFGEKVWRWTRRNPFPATVVSLVAVICLMVMAGVLYFARLSNEHAAELKIENSKVKAEKSKTEEAVEKLKRSVQAGRGHLYHAYVGQARASAISQAQGQNYAALSAIRFAAGIVPRLNLSPERADRRYEELSQVAIRAMGNWDLQPLQSRQVSENESTRFAVCFQARKYAVAERTGKISVRKLGKDHKLTDETILELGPSNREAWSLQFSPDGRFLAAVYHLAYKPGPVQFVVWDLESGNRALKSDRFLSGSKFDFSKDSSCIAFCPSKNRIEIRDLFGSGKSVEIKLDGTPARLQFGPDQILSASMQKQPVLRFWKTRDQVKLLSEIKFDDRLTAYHWSVANHQLAIAEENRIRLFSLTDDLILSPPYTPADQSPTVPVDQDSNSSKSVDDILEGNNLVQENQEDDQPVSEIAGNVMEFSSHTNRVVSLHLHPSGKALISTAWDGTTRLYSTEEKRECLRINGNKFHPESIDPSGELIAYSNKSTEIGIWKVESERPMATRLLNSIRGYGQQSCFVPGRSVWVGCPVKDGLEIWNHQSDQVVTRLACGTIRDLQFVPNPMNPNEGSLYVTGDQGLRRWKYKFDSTEEQLEFFDPEVVLNEKTYRMTWDRSLRRAAVRTSAYSVTVVNLNGDPPVRMGAHRYMAWAKISPDGKHVVTTTWQGAGVKRWNAETGELIEDLWPEVSTAVIGCSDNELVVQSGDKARIWSLPDWTLSSELARENPDGWPGAVCFSPDQRWMLSAHSRYQVQISDATTGDKIGVLESPFRTTVGGLKWSADGRFVLVGDSDVVQVWDLEDVSKRLKSLRIDVKFYDGEP